MHSSGRKKSNQAQDQSWSFDPTGCVAPDPNHGKIHFKKVELRNVDVLSRETLMVRGHEMSIFICAISFKGTHVIRSMES
jgi:hypothetical protein